MSQKVFIDCHNHILPGIDDGAKDMSMALDMLRVAENNKISDVVLTPHHLNGAFDNQQVKVRQALKDLQNEANKHNITIRLHLGSEVHLTHETVEQLISGDALTYCDHGKAALIELPKHSIPLGAEKAFSDLLAHGITPIIAHPERNSSIRNNLDILKRYIDMGCKSQLTAMSCTGEFGPELQASCFKMIQQGIAHLVASDAHRPDVRKPDLRQAEIVVTKKLGHQCAYTLFRENPENLLNNKTIANVSFKKRKLKLFFKKQ